ncbi:MAG: type VI secretion system-associated FHA domain protein TagH [Rhodoferax sp.]|uniref:type VI secretion system-associated FHA domain protein TagH n=1 Tax=Rhodoferax sp. TaxID=50421 RepID=UPI001B6620E1|nr:type VI secretion system-associated FHA domain protein TagH [Rhodoferax sp.]MBP9905607.1 type VI secretion system-associated FHA domain protein TagH [Rhodoferax sp.]
MSEITLEVVSIDSVPASDRRCAFSGVGGTIGRDEGNTMVLQDKHRRVSRLHASITFPDGVPTVANASTTLPISVGTTLLNHGEKMRLHAGDLIEIGPFVLRVRTHGRSDTEDTLIAHVQPTLQLQPIKLAEPIVSSLALGQPDPLAALMGIPAPANAGDPFADLFADLMPAKAIPEVIAPLAPAPAPAPAPALPPVPRPAPAPPPTVAQYMPAGIPAASPHGEVDPFADLLGLGVPSNGSGMHAAGYGGPSGFYGAAHSAPNPAPSPTVTSASVFAPMPSSLPSQRPQVAIIPEDFNPFALPSEVSRNSADPLSQMLGGGAAQADVAIGGGDLSIDALFSPSAASPFAGLIGAEPSAGMGPAPTINGLTANTENSDPLAMFGVAADAPGASMYAPVRDDLPEIGGAYQPPKAFFPDARPSYGASSPSPFFAGASQGQPAANANADALTAAFLNAVGLPPGALPGGLTPELMTVIGGLLRTATAGAIDMLAARAATKLELQASVTIISSQSNNPLKFLPNAESALQQMLGKKMPGFMRADQAMRDAFDDLRAHEIGVIAGTRAALTEVLGRFDPSALEKRLAGGSLLDSLMPSIRKTKLWEIYLEQYAKIRREAEDDFQSIFGRSFLEAYEQETNRVKSHATHSGSI